jgi:hypothetical protein
MPPSAAAAAGAPHRRLADNFPDLDAGVFTTEIDWDDLNDSLESCLRFFFHQTPGTSILRFPYPCKRTIEICIDKAIDQLRMQNACTSNLAVFASASIFPSRTVYSGETRLREAQIEKGLFDAVSPDTVVARIKCTLLHFKPDCVQWDESFWDSIQSKILRASMTDMLTVRNTVAKVLPIFRSAINSYQAGEQGSPIMLTASATMKKDILNALDYLNRVCSQPGASNAVTELQNITFGIIPFRGPQHAFYAYVKAHEGSHIDVRIVNGGMGSQRHRKTDGPPPILLHTYCFRLENDKFLKFVKETTWSRLDPTKKLKRGDDVYCWEGVSDTPALVEKLEFFELQRLGNCSVHNLEHALYLGRQLLFANCALLDLKKHVVNHAASHSTRRVSRLADVSVREAITRIIRETVESSMEWFNSLGPLARISDQARSG